MKVYELIEVNYFQDTFALRTCKEVIGIYSTEEKAREKIKEIKREDRDYHIKLYELDK